MRETTTNAAKERTFALCSHDTNDCFANREGVCLALKETYPGRRRCPFYKTREQRTFGLASSAARLVAMGREELIDYPTYKTKIEDEKKRAREKDEGEPNEA